MTDAIHLGNLHYKHPRKGSQPITVSRRSLTDIKVAYVGSPAIQAELQKLGVTTKLWDDALKVLKVSMQRGLIVGCSGFTKPGFKYDREEQILSKIYHYLCENSRKPVLSTDGGGKEGVLGLNAELANKAGIATFGCTPLNALDKGDLSPRTHSLIWGETYRVREKLVGSFADLQLCIGGGDGTQRECQEAIMHGSVALLVAAQTDTPGFVKNYASLPDLETAARSGRLFVCGPEDDLTAKLDQALAACEQAKRQSRIPRLRLLAEQLTT